MESTEAKSSVTYSITRNGFNMLYTVRSDSGMTLIDTMDTIEKKLLDKGYKPQEKRTFGAKPQETVPDRKCPLCGNPLVKATTKDGKKFIKCSTNKWDFATKQATGCKFTEWEDKLPDKIY